MPRMAAAPLGPAMRHSVWRKARRMCWRSASPRVEIEEVAGAEEVKEVEADKEGSAPASAADLISESGPRSPLPAERRPARSTKFSSSRTFPGQEKFERAPMAPPGTDTNA